MEEKSVKNKFLAAGAILIFAVLLGGFSLYKSFRSPATDTQARTTTPEPAVEGTSSLNEPRVIEVEAGSFYFSPNEIKIGLGETVKIVLVSTDMMHDFNIDELGVKIPITRAGGTATVEFTATKAGEFEYYCSVGNHRQQGQVGKLIVE